MPGTPLKAAADGKVVLSGYNGGFGIMLQIKHKYGFSTVYAHCMRSVVQKGDYVKKGQVVAYMGRSGAATGYHVHFEVRLNNHTINPRPFMTFDRL
jgi:murein DD-endopeptidase MepM/ murein hydrolase activator NlpD